MTVESIKDGWEKTWPGIRLAVSGGLADFVLAAEPEELGAAVPVFYYHTVEHGTLEADLVFLRRNGYTTITADALADHLEGIAPAPPRSVVLTFDDGAVNLFSTVWPLLRAHACTAVAFISPWYHDAATAAAAAAPRSERVCTWPEIEAMDESGCIDVQSHTHEHRYLPRWPEPLPLTGVDWPARPPASGHAPASVKDDLVLAKETIERRLGKPVRHLAFPRYHGTEEAIALGTAVGYRAFWWGGLPGRPLNRPGDPLTHIVRTSGEYVRRLPGTGRMSIGELAHIRCRRQITSLRKLVSGVPSAAGERR